MERQLPACPKKNPRVRSIDHYDPVEACATKTLNAPPAYFTSSINFPLGGVGREQSLAFSGPIEVIPFTGSLHEISGQFLPEQVKINHSKSGVEGGWMRVEGSKRAAYAEIEFAN